MSRFDDIEAALQDYFDALYNCDVTLLGRVFHPLAIYATADETPLLHRTLPEYLKAVAARQSPRDRNEPRRDKIDDIQLAGDNTAMARVRCSIGTRDFTDFLTLIRTEGQWRIIAKIFQITERSA